MLHRNHRIREATHRVTRSRRLPDASRARRIAAPRTQPHGRLALIVALLLAVTWQSFVTQTHRHYDRGAIAAAAAVQEGGGAALDPQGKHAPSGLPDNCPICREIAHAGPVVLPAPVAIFVPVAVAFFATLAAPLGLALAGRSHIWRSRAPPLPLPA